MYLTTFNKCYIFPFQPHEKINPLFYGKNFGEKTKSITFAPAKAESLVQDASAEKTGKSYTVSSLRILQDGNVAKVVGCSGAM